MGSEKREGPYPLFYRDDIVAWFTGNYAQVEREISGIANEEVNADPEIVRTTYLNKFRIEPLRWGYKNISIELPEKLTQAPNGEGRTLVVPTLYIPFEGNKGILMFKPEGVKPWSVGVFFEGNNLVVELPAIDYDIEEFESLYEGVKCNLETGVARLNRDVEEYNRGLGLVINKAINKKADMFNKKAEFVRRLKLSVKLDGVDSPSEKRDPPPVIAERAPTPKVEKPTNETRDEYLDPGYYNRILETITAAGTQLERTASSFRDLDEPALRDAILLGLRTTLTYSATGESFTVDGKSDIMLKRGHAVLFIAECKIWAGEKNFLASIDQLEGYLTHRDNKTAVIIFDKGKTIQTYGVIKKVAMKHGNIISELKPNKGDWLEFEFRNSKDPTKFGSLAVLRFHLPPCPLSERKKTSNLKAKRGAKARSRSKVAHTKARKRTNRPEKGP